MYPNTSPNPSQLSALALQAGAFSGAVVSGLAVSRGEHRGILVAAALGSGFVFGAIFGWLTSRALFASGFLRLPSGRLQTVLISLVASAASAAAAVNVLSLLGSSPVPLFLPLLVVLAIAVAIGSKGTGP